jgi:hypothetical protein
MARTMLKDSKLGDIFWVQVVHTTIHILNRGMLRSNNDKTPYELWKGRPTNIKHFRVFGRKCYIKREDNKVGKFDSRVDEGILIGYSRKSKAYKCYNLRLNKIVESINVKVDETNVLKTRKESINSKEQEAEEELKKKEEVVRRRRTRREEPEAEKKKHKTINKISRHLLRHLNAGIRRIIHQNKLLGIKMQE